ncbi:unnamed protein product [Rotaria sp. Silwood2]|nr:unnamed protein product [Rotaria sp. Silwood2]CAF2811909.1 unnamed protein product [Rotaria sp. Silwood2]CAF2977912.1 unnamed protein product [Rotaria sp. Silwood2]CAF3868395.1 unnamed protein product [Rotaria sp. Silwood2]CAF3894114.1 unnamed protein product [Rotaria sp. Silwood2]
MLTSTEIPLYRVQGTHYECGRTIGNLCRERILRRIANDLPLLTPLFDFAQTEQGLELFNGFTEPIRLTFPWYWDELCGLVEGSGVPLEKLLVLNFEKETRMVFHLFEETNTCGKQVEDENGAHDCTTVLINRPDTDAIEILHNEDSSIALYHTAYLIEANIKSVAYNDHQRQSPNEKFIAFCYAGVIPDTYLVAKNYLVHYNHYQRLHELVVERQPLSLTRAREQRGLELGEIHNVNDALVLLGDQTDENYPIFCVPTKTDLNLATLCTIRFKFLTHQLIIYRSNPNENRDPLLTYNLAELWNSEDNNN